MAATPPVVPAATPPVVPAATTPTIAPTPTVLPSLTASRKVNIADIPASVTFDDPRFQAETYGGNVAKANQAFMDFQNQQKINQGLVQRQDAEGNLLPFWDALDSNQAVVTSPTGQTMITNKALVPKTKKKKKKKDVKTTVAMPALVSQGELLF
jgi:hypothetical protein